METIPLRWGWEAVASPWRGSVSPTQTKAGEGSGSSRWAHESVFVVVALSGSVLTVYGIVSKNRRQTLAGDHSSTKLARVALVQNATNSSSTIVLVLRICGEHRWP